MEEVLIQVLISVGHSKNHLCFENTPSKNTVSPTYTVFNKKKLDINSL